nr:glycosyltransferase family 2 protein [Pararhodobacter sp. SW119]
MLEKSDTLVVIYSCQKYLGNRIPKIRETWLADLKARGIPYVIVVGEGDDTLDGDILRLDVPDSYEALPSKTLKMIEWVFTRTGYQYLLKIDDDCYLSVDRFFDGVAYRKHHYFGRILERSEGETQRAWHRAKSTSKAAKTRLDRSPEPSRYCDGGSGYTLSRYAMRKATEAASDSAGQWLISVSFMEDKLLGDLLASQFIAPREDDHFVHVLRRTHANADPVTMYKNSFLPSRASPTMLVHLDRADTLGQYHRVKDTDALLPRRIWPTFSSVQLGANSNQLEYITPVQRLERLRSADLVVVAVIRNEMIMLPHFLAHYRSLGVTAFLIADNLSDDSSREYLLEQEDVALYSVETEYSASHYGVAWQQALIANHCLGKWVLLVDADEFLTYPDVSKRPLSEVTAALDAADFDCIGTTLVDMYPRTKLANCDFRKGAPFELAPYHDDPPLRLLRGGGAFSNTTRHYASNLRHRLAPGSQPALFMAIKHPLFRYAPWLRLSEGIHFIANVRISPDFLTLAHFKYHAGFAKKVENEIGRKQHFAGAIEYQKYRTMLAEARGTLFRADVSRKIDQTLLPAKWQK